MLLWLITWSQVTSLPRFLLKIFAPQRGVPGNDPERPMRRLTGIDIKDCKGQLVENWRRTDTNTPLDCWKMQRKETLGNSTLSLKSRCTDQIRRIVLIKQGSKMLTKPGDKAQCCVYH